MKFSIFTALAAVLALSACSNVGVYPSQTGRDWKDVDDNGVSVGRGARECKEQAKLSAAHATGIKLQADVAGDLYEQCMQRRGY